MPVKRARRSRRVKRRGVRKLKGPSKKAFVKVAAPRIRRKMGKKGTKTAARKKAGAMYNKKSIGARRGYMKRARSRRVKRRRSRK